MIEVELKHFQIGLIIFVIASFTSPCVIIITRYDKGDAILEGLNGNITIDNVYYSQPMVKNEQYAGRESRYGNVTFVYTAKIVELINKPSWTNYPRVASENLKVPGVGSFDITKVVDVNAKENLNNTDLDEFRGDPWAIDKKIWIYRDRYFNFKEGVKYNVKWKKYSAKTISDYKPVGVFSPFERDKMWIKGQYLNIISIMFFKPRFTDDLAIVSEATTFWAFFFVLSYFLNRIFKRWKVSFIYGFPTTIAIVLLMNSMLGSIDFLLGLVFFGFILIIIGKIIKRLGKQT